MLGRMEREFGDRQAGERETGAPEASGAAPVVPPVPPPAERGFGLAVTDRLGLERIERFSLAAFFSGVLTSRSSDQIEDHLSVGFRGTTPPLIPAMAEMPTPWLFGRCLLVTLLVFVPLYYALAVSGNVLLLPGVILIGAFAVPISTLVLFFELNTPRNVSITRVSLLFMMGAAVSLLLSTLLFENLRFLAFFGPPIAGLFEELGKLAALAIVTRHYDERRYPYGLNGLLFGAAVGAGFAAFETAGYALVFGLKGGGNAMVAVLQMRGLLAPFAHIVWTAMIGCLFWRAQVRGLGFVETLREPSFRRVLLAAMTLHAVWNLNLGLPFGANRIAAGLISWIIIISLVQSGLREVGRMARGPADGATDDGIGERTGPRPELQEVQPRSTPEV